MAIQDTDIGLVMGLIIYVIGWIAGSSAAATKRARVSDLMAIIIDLDVVLAKRKMKSAELAEAIGITPQNLSVLRAGRAKAVRFTTLDAI